MYSSVTSCTCQAGDLDGLNCVVPTSMKCVVQVLSVLGIYLYLYYQSLSQFTRKYNGLLIKSHKSRGD